MKINEVTKKIEPSKPRNFVAKNATTGGAGAHKDKKKAVKQGESKHKGKQFDMSAESAIEETEQNIGTVSAVSPDGKQVTVKQADGGDLTTTADAFLPGANNTVAMKPDAAGTTLKPGATVTQTTTAEDSDEPLLPIAPDDQHIHGEEDPDLMGSGHNHDIGGDPTDRFIDQVRDKEFERTARGGREGFAGRAKMSESDELMKMLTIAGLK